MKIAFKSIIAFLSITSAFSVYSDGGFKVDETRIKVALEDHLKDAESARLRKLTVQKGEGGISYKICGEVNGKNSYGAYSGYEKFYGMYFPKDDAYFILVVGGVAPEMCKSEFNKKNKN